MPTYDFKCKDCGNKFTVIVSISEKDKVKCPKCQSSNIQQLLTGFFTKGSSCGSTEQGGG
ncbi:MAG: zinc ribbon domain-containing protein [Desulfotomaculum sp.]|nr:zinc ribbon domain-containing protein [Desulfotomaculum sp.]